jgi:hypothetical protein
MAMNFCAECGARRVEQAKFCGQCGTQFFVAQEHPWPEFDKAQAKLDDWVRTYRPLEYLENHMGIVEEPPSHWDSDKIWTQFHNGDTMGEFIVPGFFSKENTRGHFLTAEPAPADVGYVSWDFYIERDCPICEPDYSFQVIESASECQISYCDGGIYRGELVFDWNSVKQVSE